jgi:hypothetical protein
MHRGGSRVVGVAGEYELHSGLADEGLDDSKRGVLALKDGPLLDVKLKKSEGVAG